MKGKWIFFVAVTVLVFGAARAIWIRQDVSLPDARNSLHDQQHSAHEVAMKPVQVDSEPLENMQDHIEMVSSASIEMASLQHPKMEPQETARRKPGEPQNPPPIPEQFPEPPAPQMGWAEAQYEIDGRIVAPGNRFGQMTLVHVKPSAEISATLKWPKAAPGATVILEVVDGGRLDGDQLSQLVRVDEQGEVHLHYVANRQPGRCQIVARCGMDETMLCFWVADEWMKNTPVGL